MPSVKKSSSAAVTSSPAKGKRGSKANVAETKHVEPDSKQSLDNFLKNRPEKGNVAPSLAAAQEDLKRKKVEDNLKGKLARRSSKEELLNANILKADPTSKNSMAGPIQSAAMDLQKSQLQDNLNKHMQSRPDQKELMDKKILQDETSGKKLKKRPSEIVDDAPAEKTTSKRGRPKKQ